MPVGTRRTALGPLAVRLALLVVVVLVAAYAAFFAAYAVGGDPAVSDTWVGYLAGIALLGELAGSLVAFVLAVAARVRHEPARRLWVPLGLLPALLTLVVVAEVFWME